MTSVAARWQGLVFTFALAFALAQMVASANGQTLNVIHGFTGGSDGSNPFSTLVMDSAGNLYGTAGNGGDGSGCDLFNSPGCGTIYKLTNDGGTWDFSTLYQFEGSSDGSAPLGSVFIGTNNALYGATATGGTGSCTYYGNNQCGVVFALASGARKDRVIYRFSGGTDGARPLTAGVISVKGNFYGVTSIGGDLSCNSGKGCGVFYEVTPTGKETVLHTFTMAGGDGAYPLGNLIADAAGNLYGITASGGLTNSTCSSGCGTIFEMLHSASGWTEKILYSFTGQGDGENPNAGLIFDSKGNLYGNTWQGGAGGGGTVFELHKNASRTWSLYVLYSFETAGYSVSPLVMDSKNVIYGTTQGGGTYNFGRIYKLIPNGQNWSYQELYDFTGMSDGGNPLGGLVLDSAGNLYGTTIYYGPFECAGGVGCGEVFEFTP